jgi:hypothetical protein
MSEPTRPFCDENRPGRDEHAAVGAESVLLEWLRAVRGLRLADTAALRAWATDKPAAFRTAFATFAGLDAADSRIQAGAEWLLGAGVRPDDRVQWTGDPADPWLEGRVITGAVLTDDPARATIVLGEPVAWPPADIGAPAPSVPPRLRPPASGPGAG